MKSRAVVSFANDAGNYNKMLQRLKLSLQKFSDVPFYGIYGESLIGSPPHKEDPYAFKIYCIEGVRSLGYEQILWVDSSNVAVSNLSPIWDIIDTDGYIMQYAGHLVGRWCNERTLEYFDITREEAMNMPMYGNAGFLGLDFTTQVANDFFSKWKQSMLDGQFKGSWVDHRHDMTCGSIIANKLGMKYQSAEELLDYADSFAPRKNETIIFHAKGL